MSRGMSRSMSGYKKAAHLWQYGSIGDGYTTLTERIVLLQGLPGSLEHVGLEGWSVDSCYRILTFYFHQNIKNKVPKSSVCGRLSMRNKKKGKI